MFFVIWYTPPTQSWKEDFQATMEREPPDCWDIEVTDGPDSPQAAVYKPWRGAATLIPKVPVATKKQYIDCKQVSGHQTLSYRNVTSVS